MNYNAMLYALGAILLGAIGIWFHDFAMTWQPVPAGIGARTILAYLSGLLLVVGGGAILTRRGERVGALLLAVFYGIWVIFLHGPIVLGEPGALYKWNGVAEIAFLTTGGIALLAASGGTRGTVATTARLIAGACAICFGSTHLVYAKQTAEFVPAWIPPNQLFWAYATGVGYIAAGLALVTRVQSQLAATLMAAMMASFVVLLHIPRVIGSPTSQFEWTMLAVASSLTGAALLVRKYTT
ncbi:MAG: hypothetical protein ABI769_06085 [Pseudomonadota bacterium]